MYPGLGIFDITVRAGNYFNGKINGICGNYNGIATDDQTNPNYISTNFRYNPLRGY